MSDAASRLEVAQASRILSSVGVVDAFGHVSRRSREGADAFYLSRSLAPALVRVEDVLLHDLDGNLVAEVGTPVFLERFIHAEIYRARPDVNAVVHSHDPSVLPFTVVPGASLQPICHVCGFLAGTQPPFDVTDVAGDATNLLIQNPTLGRQFAAHLDKGAVALMRAHGFTVVGASIPQSVFRAIYTARNCQIQLAAMQLGKPRYLSDGEAAACESTTSAQADRAWKLWVHQFADPSLLGAS